MIRFTSSLRESVPAYRKSRNVGFLERRALNRSGRRSDLFGRRTDLQRSSAPLPVPSAPHQTRAEAAGGSTCTRARRQLTCRTCAGQGARAAS
eukprot:2867784-Rhodomonas_salina.3